MELNLRQLLGYARRWWWVLILFPLLAGAASYTVSSRQQPLYSATATLLVNPASNGTANELTSISAGQQLVLTYQQLVVTSPVLQAAIKQLGLPYSVDTLKKKVSATASQNTQLLRVSVSDSDPRAAAAIANAIADQFASFITAQTAASNSPARTTLEKLIANTQQQLDATNSQIAALEAKPSLDAAGQDQLSTLRLRASQQEQSLSDLLVQEQQMDLATANAQTRVVSSVPATPPTQPYAPRVLFTTLLAVFVAGLLAVGTVALLEYLDNSVRSTDDLVRLTDSPTMAVITAAPKIQPGGRQVYVLSDPASPASEAIRLLRANLEFAAAAKPLTTVAISSPGPAEGKSTVTANLGVVMAQAGFETVIIDADLRKPTQHKIFGVDNQQGLTTLLSHSHQEWHTTAVHVAVPRLSLVPSGPLPPNPTDLLSLDRFHNLLEEISSTVDVVLIDTPPVLAVSDPLVVSTKSDGVLLVCRSGQTRLDALRRASASFHQGNVRLIGTVMNQQRRRDDANYYYYTYYGSDTKKDVHAASTAHLNSTP